MVIGSPAAEKWFGIDDRKDALSLSHINPFMPMVPF